MDGYPARMRQSGDDLGYLPVPAAERDQIIVSLRSRGWSDARIAKSTGMSISGVRSSLIRIQQGKPGRAPR
jgi:hypothetical protein